LQPKLIADSLKNTSAERVYVALYGLTLLSTRFLLSALDAYARREHLYRHDEADKESQTDRRKLWPVVGGYVIAILIGIAAPTVAELLYLALAVYLVVPFNDVRRLFFMRT
jgi:hypothetical protein